MKLTLKIGAAILVFVAVLAMPSYSGLRSGDLKVQKVEVPGTHPVNTVAVYNQAPYSFIMVAPYYPSAEGAWDNNRVLIFNRRNPREEKPIEIDLGPYYYPTNIVCSGTDAFIRATEFTLEGTVEVIIGVQLHLEDGKPGASQPVVIRIPGFNDEPTNSKAPIDMVLGLRGRYLFFLSGPCAYSYNLVEGYVSKVCFISPGDYSLRSFIWLAGFDEKSKTLAIAHNTEKEDLDGKLTRKSVLRFYQVDERGLFTIGKIVDASEFKEGVSITPDSEVAIFGDEEGQPDFACFGASDGSVNLVSLQREPFKDDLFGKIRQIGQFAELAHNDGDSDPGPRIAKLDPSGGTLLVVKPGDVLLNIRRPALVNVWRSGNIRRPALVRSQESTSILGGKLNGKRTKLIQTAVLTEPFLLGQGIVGVDLSEGAEGIFTTRSGQVLSIVLGKDDVNVLGELGSVDFSTVEEGSIIALSSAQEPEDGRGEEPTPGLLIVANRKDGKGSSVGMSVVQMLSPSAPPLASVFTSIRRPCNLGR